MPLVRGYSRGAISENISREMHAGRDQEQAVAIALDVARRAYRQRHPRGRVPAHLRRNPEPDGQRVRSLGGPRAGKYTTILSDPPWDPRDGGRSRGGYFYGFPSAKQLEEDPNARAANKRGRYKVLSLDRLKRLPVDQLAAKNAHLYLWATNATMAPAYELVKAWGFKPWTVMYWEKPRIMMPTRNTGHGVRSQTEPLIIARRGHAPFRGPIVGNVVHAPYVSKRGGGPLHSGKPQQFYDLIERMAPPGPRLEIFSRGRREGWDAYGHQATQRVTKPRERTAPEGTQTRRKSPMRNPVSMMQTGAGYYVSGACGTGGRSFPRGKDGKRAAQLYLYEQRRIEDEGGCRNPRDYPSVVANPRRRPTAYLRGFRSANRRLTAAQAASTREMREMARRGEADLLERQELARRRRHRRRGATNPMGHGEWIDVLVPLVALFVLVRGGILRLGRNTPSAAAPRP